MKMDQFYERLDSLFSTGQIDRVENFLKESKEQAQKEQDKASLLAILNESMGYYRSIGSREAVNEAEEALALSESMGLAGTVHEGTTLLNVATVYRAFGMLDKAEELYQRGLEIYKRELDKEDYRLAGLYNNLSSLYADREEFSRAIEALLEALSILEKNEGTEMERAVSLTNLTINYLRNNQVQEAENVMGQALSLFESQPGERDAHYGMALAARAEIYYVKREYQDAILIYRQALEELRRCYGESLIYAAALENCAHICITAGYAEDSEPLLAHAAQIREVCGGR